MAKTRPIESWGVMSTPREHASRTPGAKHPLPNNTSQHGVKEHVEYPAFLSACSQSLLWLAPRCLTPAVDRLLSGVWAQLQLLNTTRQSHCCSFDSPVSTDPSRRSSSWASRCPALRWVRCCDQ